MKQRNSEADNQWNRDTEKQRTIRTRKKKDIKTKKQMEKIQVNQCTAVKQRTSETEKPGNRKTL